MKARCRILMIVWGLLLLMTGCGGYTNASEEPPKNWSKYSAGDASFRFMAGWSETDAEALTGKTESNMVILNQTTELTLLANFVSPTGEQGTVNYLQIGYYTLTEEITGEDLESIMGDLDVMTKTLKNSLGVDASIEQNARIRHYGDHDALTLAYRLGYEEAACVTQIGLVPKGNRLYQIVYSDFTTIKDDSTLERLLTSLTLA